MQPLDTKQQDVCIYTGIFGALISATCLIQHIAITRGHWLTFILLFIYLYILASFILLALLRSYSFILLFISAIFLLLAELVLVLGGVFSLVVGLHFIYTIAILTFMLVEQYPRKLKARSLALREEERAWRAKI